MTPYGIETTTLRFVVQLLNHCATAVPLTTVMEFNFPQQATISRSVARLLASKDRVHSIDNIFSCQRVEPAC